MYIPVIPHIPAAGTIVRSMRVSSRENLHVKCRCIVLRVRYNIAEHWNLEFKIHFPVFLDRSNKLDMALTEYLYIKLLSFLHNDSYHVI
jgi:hypothetical protein